MQQTDSVFQDALRYLGAPEGDEAAVELIEEAFDLLGDLAPAHVLVTMPAEEVAAAFDNAAITDFLVGCKDAQLFVGTMGMTFEMLLRKTSSTDSVLALALHACAVAVLEDYEDRILGEHPRIAPSGLAVPLSLQRVLLALTDAENRLGVTLTDSFLMIPTKSISCIVAADGEKSTCTMHRCEHCPLTTCAYRKKVPV